MKTIKHFLVLLLAITLFASCKKNNELDEFKQGVQITIERQPGAPEALGRIWFVSPSAGKADTLAIKANRGGWVSGVIEHFSLNDGTEPTTIWLPPTTKHGARVRFYLRNYRTMGETGNDNMVVSHQLDIPKGKVQKILIKQYKKKLSIFLNEKVLKENL